MFEPLLVSLDLHRTPSKRMQDKTTCKGSEKTTRECGCLYLYALHADQRGNEPPLALVRGVVLGYVNGWGIT
jgi:hypothetical protein